MNFKTRLKSTHTQIDLTSLVDVVFLLLIFFVITSNVLPLKSLRIEHPTLEENSPALTTQLLVVVDAQNVIYVGSKKVIVDLATLKENLEREVNTIRKLHANALPTVVLSMDRRVEYETFLRIFSVAQECCPRLRLAFQPLGEI